MTDQKPWYRDVKWRVSCTRVTMDRQKWYRVISENPEWEECYVPFGDSTPEDYKRCTDHAELIASAPETARERDCLLEALTASGDTKAAYSGEFKFPLRRSGYDEDGEHQEWSEDAIVPWDTIKQIMKAIAARAALSRAKP